MTPFRTAPCALVAAFTLPALMLAADVAAHGKAHQHGVATLDVVVAGSVLTIELDTPLDNLVGFERAPRTDAERGRVQKMASTLRAADALFKPDPAARCTLGPVQLDAPILGLKDAAGAAAPSTPSTPAGKDHADLAARFEFRCEAPAQLQQIDIALFSAFNGFKRIQVQMDRDGRQGKRALTTGAAKLALPR